MVNTLSYRLACLIVACSFYIAIIPSALAESVGWDEEKESWKKQESTHFVVIYLSQYQQQADRVLQIAETIHTQLYPFYKVTPKKKTRIILTDDSDLNYTLSDTLEYGEIRLSMSPPTDVIAIESEDDWFHLFLLNEYSQILHFSLASGTFRGMILAAEFTPTVLYKGVALYLQNNNDLDSNLINLSTSEMKMRIEVQAKQLRDLDKIVIQTREWPYDAMYLYGAYFIDFLSKTYGEDKVLAFLQDYSQSLIAYLFLNIQTTPYFGKDLYTLWSEFHVYIEHKFSAQINLVDTDISGEKISDLRFILPTASGENGLLIGVTNGEDRHTIKQRTENGWELITYVNRVSTFDNHPTQGLLVSRNIEYVDQHSFNDIFIFNEEKWQRITHQQRFKYVKWMNSGKQFLASRIVKGISELWLFTLDQSTPPQQIWQGEADEIIGEFDVSPDDSYIVASIKRPLQSWKLAAFDLNHHTWENITGLDGTETAPSFMPDGTILYSANYNHNYNIFQYIPRTQKIEQLTDVMGGAFRPIWQEGLGIVFQTYEKDGYALRHITNPTAVNHVTYAKQKKNQPIEQYDTDIFITEPEDYEALKTIQSHSLYPLLFADEIRTLVGINTYGADALGRHKYDIYALWDVVYDQASYVFQYQYDNRWTLSYTQDYNFDNVTPDQDTPNYQISQTEVYLMQRDNIFNAWEDRLGFHAGVTYTLDNLVSTPNVPSILPTIDDTDAAELTLGLGFTFDNREYYLNVPGTGWGHYFDFTFEENILKADFSGRKYQTQWLFTFDLPKRFTLLTRLSAGFADSDAKPFAVGGQHLSEEMRLFDRTQQSIRGYDDLSQQGNIYVTQRVELNSFLGRFEQNFGLFPLGIGDIAGKVYMDSGTAWDEGESPDPLIGIGAQIQVEFKLGYNYNLPISFGYAQGLDKNLGKNYLYMNFGQSY